MSSKSSVLNIPFRQRLGLEIFRKYRKNETTRHKLNYLFWECTLRCNLNCKHCGSDCHKDVQQKDMPMQDFLSTLDKITPHVTPNKTIVVITGGEPLMRKDLEECGREIIKRGYPWGMVTNGLFLTRERLLSLLEAGLHAITISLDGFQESHNEMRRNKESFQCATHAIKMLSVVNGLAFDVVTCVTPKNISELPKLKEFLIEIGVKEWRLFTVFPIGRAAENQELQLTAAEFKSVFDFVEETKKEGRIVLNYGCEGFLGRYESKVRDSFFFCRAGVTVGSILNDGSISACPNLRKNFIQGNIYQDDFMTVWNNKYQLHRDRSWAKKGECEDCKYFRYCEGNGLHLRDEENNLLFCHLKRIQEGEIEL